MRPLRIAQVLTNLHDGGIEKLVQQIAVGLPSDRFEVRVFALIDRNPWLHSFKDAGIDVTVLGAKNSLSLSSLLPNLRAVWRLARELRKWECEVVNAHDFFPGILGRVAAWLAGVPRVYATLHNTYSWFGPGHHFVNRLMARGTDRLIAVSEAALNASQSKDRLPPNKYHLITNGVDPVPLLPDESVGVAVRQELGIADSAFVIGNVGTLSVRKDQRTLLIAAASLLPQYDIRVVLIGSGRLHEHEIELELHRLAETPALKGRVSFLEDRHDMHRLYNAFDLYCMPSITEGLSLASIEAMMAGRVVVYSDIEPFCELVEDKIDGFLFRTGDPEELARVLQDAIEYPQQQRELMQQTARVRKVASHGLAPMLEKYAMLYLEGRRGS